MSNFIIQSTIKKIYKIILIAGILTVNNTYTAFAATYIQDMDAVMFAGLMSVCMVYSWKKGGKNIYLGIPCLVISLGIYQCMISVAITLIIMLSVINLLCGGGNAKRVFLDGLKSIGIIAISSVLYLLLVKAVCVITHIELATGYNGLTNLLNYDKSLKNILFVICNTYRQVLNYYISQPTALHFIVNKHYYVLFIYSGIVYIRAMCSKEISILNKLFITILICVLPLGMNIASFADGGMVHMLMMYSLWLIYVLVIKTEEWNTTTCKKHRYISCLNCVIYIIIFAIIWNNIQVSNAAYVKKDLERQSTLSIMTEVNADMHDEGYVDGETKVHFVGKPQMGSMEVSYVRGITGLGHNSQITYQRTYATYYRYILQRPINIKISNDDEKYKDMPCYPEDGYIQWYDDMMVVKLSD